MGRTLLVRIGENAGDNHLVEYEKGSAAWVKDKINKRRVSKEKTTTASKTPEAAAAAATMHHHLQELRRVSMLLREALRNQSRDLVLMQNARVVAIAICI